MGPNFSHQSGRKWGWVWTEQGGDSPSLDQMGCAVCREKRSDLAEADTEVCTVDTHRRPVSVHVIAVGSAHTPRLAYARQVARNTAC